MDRLVNKLIMITTTTHRLPYGTMLSVVSEHRNQKGWIATAGETGQQVYVAKEIVKEL